MSFVQVTLNLLSGFLNTIRIFFITLGAALPLGLIISFGSMSKFKPLKFLTKTFVWIIRGSPLMLQIVVVFYGPGLIFGWPIKSRMTAVLIAFIINYAAYFSEIYRGGIEGIPVGQYEAGHVLGLTKSQIFFKIVLFQVVRRIVPPMSNEIITLVKDTSLASTIGVIELVLSAKQIVATKAIIWPLFYIGAFYLIFTGALTLIFGAVEKKMDFYKV